MITGKDSRIEVKKAEEIVADEKATLIAKLTAILKVISVGIKIALNNRLNIVRIMEHLKIAKIKSETQREEETEEK